jgi:hypothetical protein
VLKPQKLLSYADGGMPYSKSVNEAGQQQPAAAKPSSTVSTAAAAGGAQVVRPDGFQSCMAVRFRNMKWDGATGKVYRWEELGEHGLQQIPLTANAQYVPLSPCRLFKGASCK